MPRDAGRKQRLEIAAVFQHSKVIKAIKVKERGFLALMLLMFISLQRHIEVTSHRTSSDAHPDPVISIDLKVLEVGCRVGRCSGAPVVERM